MLSCYTLGSLLFVLSWCLDIFFFWGRVWYHKTVSPGKQMRPHPQKRSYFYRKNIDFSFMGMERLIITLLWFCWYIKSFLYALLCDYYFQIAYLYSILLYSPINSIFRKLFMKEVLDKFYEAKTMNSWLIKKIFYPIFPTTSRKI